MIGVRLLQYELSSLSGWEDPISSIITQGRLYEAGATFTQGISHLLSYTLDAGYDEFVLSPGQEAKGGRFSVTGDICLGGDSHLREQILYMTSYGGTAVASLLRAEYFIWRRTSLILNSEAVAYQKITSATRNVYSTQLGLGSMMWNHFKFEFMSEYNRNDEVSDEIKFLGRVVCMEWRNL